MSDNINSRAERRKALKLNARKRKTKNSEKVLLRKLFLTIVIIGFAVLIGGAGLFAFYASSAPKLDENLLKDPLSSDILDINGECLHKSGAEKREFVPYDEIPESDARCNSCNRRRPILFPSRDGLLEAWRCSSRKL